MLAHLVTPLAPCTAYKARTCPAVPALHADAGRQARTFHVTALKIRCYAAGLAGAAACWAGASRRTFRCKKQSHRTEQVRASRECAEESDSSDAVPRARWTQLLVSYRSSLIPKALPNEIRAGSSYCGSNLAFLGDRILDVHLWKCCGLRDAEDDVMGAFTQERCLIMSNDYLSSKAETLLSPMLMSTEDMMQLSPRARSQFLEAVVGLLSEIAPLADFEAAMQEVIAELRPHKAVLGSSLKTFKKVSSSTLQANFGFKEFGTGSPRATELSPTEAWEEFIHKSLTTSFSVGHYNMLAARTGAQFIVRAWQRRFGVNESACIYHMSEPEDDDVIVLGTSVQSLTNARWQAATKLLSEVGLPRLAELCGVSYDSERAEPVRARGWWNLPQRVYLEVKHPRAAVQEISQWLGASIQEDVLPADIDGFVVQLVWKHPGSPEVEAGGTGSSKKKAREAACQVLLEKLSIIAESSSDE
eukprot:TRINITY_DN51309_c0_g1_i1.p1 TRINITY_DN51309_c0_g1~~TRINITY_DN51309_c0_g1_i1.p1  ORF type:complete len:473 (+),score=38.63 TRINITY_DN51309_c0_g1_i1:89-1507(+)